MENYEKIEKIGEGEYMAGRHAGLIWAWNTCRKMCANFNSGQERMASSIRPEICRTTAASSL